jgi:hypothetical protein
VTVIQTLRKQFVCSEKSQGVNPTVLPKSRYLPVAASYDWAVCGNPAIARLLTFEHQAVLCMSRCEHSSLCLRAGTEKIPGTIERKISQRALREALNSVVFDELA